MRQPPVKQQSSSPCSGEPEPVGVLCGSAATQSGAARRRVVTTPASFEWSRCLRLGLSLPRPPHTVHGGGVPGCLASHACSLRFLFLWYRTPVPSHFQHNGPSSSVAAGDEHQPGASDDSCAMIRGEESFCCHPSRSLRVCYLKVGAPVGSMYTHICTEFVYFFGSRGAAEAAERSQCLACCSNNSAKGAN